MNSVNPSKVLPDLRSLILAHLYFNRAIIVETQCSSKALPFTLQKWRSNVQDILTIIERLYRPEKANLFRNLVEKHSNMIADMSLRYKNGSDITNDYQEYIIIGRELAQVINRIEPRVDLPTITYFILRHHQLVYDQIIATMNDRFSNSQRLFDQDNKNIKEAIKYLTQVFLTETT